MKAWLSIRKRVESRTVSYSVTSPADAERIHAFAEHTSASGAPEQPAPASDTNQWLLTMVFPSYFLQTVYPLPSRGGLGSCKQCCQYTLQPLTSLYSGLPTFLSLNTWYKRFKFKWQTLRFENWIDAPFGKPPSHLAQGSQRAGAVHFESLQWGS